MNKACLQNNGDGHEIICHLGLLTLQGVIEPFKHQGHVLKGFFSKVGLICTKKRMMLTLQYVDALSLLDLHAMH